MITLKCVKYVIAEIISEHGTGVFARIDKSESAVKRAIEHGFEEYKTASQRDSRGFNFFVRNVKVQPRYDVLVHVSRYELMLYFVYYY